MILWLSGLVRWELVSKHLKSNGCYYQLYQVSVEVHTVMLEKEKSSTTMNCYEGAWHSLFLNK